MKKNFYALDSKIGGSPPYFIFYRTPPHKIRGNTWRGSSDLYLGLDITSMTVAVSLLSGSKGLSKLLSILIGLAVVIVAGIALTNSFYQAVIVLDLGDKTH